MSYIPHNLIIIQARTSSARLPGKVLQPIWKGKNLLDLQLEKFRRLGTPLVVATTVNPSDDAIVDWAKRNNVEAFRGDEQNVLKRFIDCARQYQAKNLIRVCSDNPFIQSDQVPYFLNSLAQGVDYISFCNHSGIPAIKTHWGLFVEGVRLGALERASEILETHAEEKFYSEHVTNFIYGNSEQFKIKLDQAPETVVSRSDLRFTIDTPDDFQNMHSLLQLAGSEANLEQLIELVDANPNIKSVMRQGIDQFNK
ncbi:cytidylyltransferase domain-containing protein [Roseivirga thermotolerans]|uniref:cytidylyltransferase domain-containing protein n=1 Tax=Roseivirga thermotolerans TaxID=1758176 RepID=UPI00273F0865|nr:hypothetical protein [Roseivirga thermotolerans]